MTTVAVASRSLNLSGLLDGLRTFDPALDLVLWPDPRFAEAEVAVCWDPPAGLYDAMPRLRLVHGVAAGVDNLIFGHDLRGLPLCRVVDPGLAEGMLEYVLWSVLFYQRDFDAAMNHQRERRWKRLPLRPAANFRVGVMGLGAIGAHIALGLAQRGYVASGWSRSAKALAGIATYAGAAEFDAFLARSDALVCLLPLTDLTRGILDARCFAALPAGAALIHCGRGEHLVAGDLIAALGSGRLRGAVLDVFDAEPLPADHALWVTPGVVVTPHMASMASGAAIGQQIAANIGRLQRGEPLRNQVDPGRGY